MTQTAVVTGAGSGIGRACALGLLAGFVNGAARRQAQQDQLVNDTHYIAETLRQRERR